MFNAKLLSAAILLASSAAWAGASTLAPSDSRTTACEGSECKCQNCGKDKCECKDCKCEKCRHHQPKR